MRSTSPGRATYLMLVIGLVAASVASPSATEAQVRRTTFQAPDRYVVLETLRDDLIHFEFGAGTAPGADSPLETTMMVHKRAYTGPRTFSATSGGVATAEAELTVDPATSCVTATSLPARTVLSTVCPANLDRDRRGLTITRERMSNVYGLGEQFTEAGDPNGDWVGRERVPGDAFGNKMVGFNGGAVGNAMFPIMYAVGAAGLNYGLFFDNVYAQRWDFRSDPWTVEARGPLRGYLILGPDLPDLRSDYLELVGRPPVPPKKAFGLWVSEYGFDNWNELDGKLASLRAATFPVDGFVMDLQWFGGIRSDSDSTSMGRVAWDVETFPDPAGKITRLRDEHGVGLILIEESYIGRALDEHTELERRGFLARQSAAGPATYIDYNPWWGKGGMIDWTNDSAGVFWHDWKRQPLVAMGVLGHWTDLGEPELYDSTSWYHGVEPGQHRHADVHNLYNLKWSESIFDSYRRHSTARRPFILTRSGTSGTQRFGTALWSGDIGANLSSLATHMNAQMHMSMSGVDYFASDIGGFHRAALDGDQDEMYTQWFANGALLDVPVRPHTENLCNCKETAPDRIGHRASNLANLRLRYALTPYYYSLAHRAHGHAEPLVAPLVHYYQNDTSTRTNGGDKLIGRDLLVATVARHGATTRDVYLPRGRWIDYYSNRSHSSSGEWLRGVPLYRDSLFRLPLFARAGAIIPQMHVDEKTMNLEGRRTDGTRRDELVVRVYADPQESSFVLYEDDGWSVAYQSDSVATTTISQQMRPGTAVVTIAAREGSYSGAPAQRSNVVQLVMDVRGASAVTLNGSPLPRHATRSAYEAAASGWYVADRVIVAKTGERPVGQEKRLEFRLPVR